MTNLIKKNTKNIFFSLLIFLFIVSSSKAEVFNEIKVSGNKRLSVETILMFSGLEVNKNLEPNDLNLAIKKLYETNYFQNIEILPRNKILEIIIIENPIIQTISINGIKNKSIIKKLRDVTIKSEKYPFLNSSIKEQKNILLNIIRSSGFYFVEVETNVTENKNNSVDIIYNFNLGERAIIKTINFQGNKIFKDTKLRNVIKSEEGKFWKFITSDKYLDERKIQIDENLLKNFYMNKGYFKVNIKSSYAKNINNEFFELNFNIDAGEKYFFKNFNYNIENLFDSANFTSIIKKTNKLKKKKFSKKKLEDIIDEINKIALQKEFVFIDVNYSLNIVDSNLINVDFKFSDLEKLFVDEINIFGNFITEEKVIRNSLVLDEGDAYNEFLLNKSVSSIKSRGFFSSVNTSVSQSPNDSQKKIIDINVVESPSGEIFAGAGAGTSGATLTAGIKEKNYLGKGIKLSTNFSLSEEQIRGKFSVVNPNFRNSDRSLNTTLESTNTDSLSTSGFKTSRTGFSVGTGFEQYDDLFVNLDISAYYEKLETSSIASNYKKSKKVTISKTW